MKNRTVTTGYRLPTTDHRLRATDYRSPMTDQPRSWAYSLRGFGVGCCEKRPGAGEERLERRDRFDSVPKPGWTLSAGLRCGLGVLVWNRWTVSRWTVVGGESVDGQAVANRWSVSRWSVVGGRWSMKNRTVTTGYRLTDHRSAGESVLGRTEGGRRTKGGQQGPGNDSPATPNRGRLDQTAESAAKPSKAVSNRGR